MGLNDDEVSPRLRELVSTRMIDRARILGAAMRVAYLISAAMPGVLPRARFSLEGSKLRLHLPADLAFLAGEHLEGRLDQLAGVAGIKSSEIVSD